VCQTRIAIWVGAIESIQGLSLSFVVFDSKDANVGAQGGQRRTKAANTMAALQTASIVVLVVLRFADVLKAYFSCGG
jgi:hypothetical protein